MPVSKATKKYIVRPLTADQISRGVGVTPEDRAIVTKVLTDLGYIGKDSAKANPSKPRKPPVKPQDR
jgi:hypothetical protein